MEEKTPFNIDLKDKKTILGIVGVLVLLIAIPLAVYLIQQKQIFKPRAAELTPVSGPETSFSVYPIDEKVIYEPGYYIQEPLITLKVKSDIDAANLFVAKLRFPANLLEVKRIITTYGFPENTFIKNWVETTYDNNAGTISIVGGVPDPGFQTQQADPPYNMVDIIFKPKAYGVANITFDSGSAIYRNSDNANILEKSTGTTFTIIPNPTITLEPTRPPATPSPTPTLAPSGQPSLQVNFVNSQGNPVPYESCGVYWSCGGGSSWTTYNCQTNSSRTINISRSHPAGWCKGIAVPGANLVGITPVPNSGLQTATKDRNLYGWENSWSSGTRTLTFVVGEKGDVNGDGKITLVDMSALLSRWGKKGAEVGGADLNKDGVVNTVDYSLMIQILIENKIIKSAEEAPLPGN